LFAFIYSAKDRACFPQTYSRGEKELCQYIKSLYSGEILENTRKFIGGKELDIYLPELKLAFEYNGEYWHQFHEEKEPGYHKNKQKACKENGIKLIEVWENDWKKNNQQIKDLISKHLQI
jgi:very-short-patch-repair endonuclease